MGQSQLKHLIINCEKLDANIFLVIFDFQVTKHTAHSINLHE
jgi:hypothetical protein